MCNDSTNGCCGCNCIGPQGPQGLPGMQGPQGAQGISGANGAQGPAGPVGPQGLPGNNGKSGPIGDTGPQGIQGVQGQSGAQGIPGPAGPIGSTGDTGPQGVQGVQGVDGINGLPGVAGPIGPIGPIGPQGIQGIQGVAGQNCDCQASYLNIFTLLDQVVASLGSPTMEMVNINSGATDFDISNASTTGEVKVLNHGIYQLSWAVDGKLTPPYPFPVPAWSFEIYINGVGAVGTSSAAFSITPDDLVVHDSADAIIEIFAGDVLKIVNTSTMSVNTVSHPIGSLIPISSVRFNLNMIKPLP